MDVIRFGRGIRALRRHKRWRQRDLAGAVGCSPSRVARVEGGHADVVTPRTLEHMAHALGARVVLRLDWNGEALDRLLDHDHAAIVETIVGILRAAGWQVLTEATFAIGGERGAVDVLAWHEACRGLLVVEAKSVVADAQDTLGKLDRKVRLASRIAPPEWRPRAVSSLLVIGDTRTNRRRIAALGETFNTACPDRIAVVRRFVRAPGERAIRGLWFLPIGTQATPRHRVHGS